MIIFDEGFLKALSNQQYTESILKDYANDTARENLLPETFNDLFRSLYIWNIEPKCNFKVGWVFLPFDYQKCNDNRSLQNALCECFGKKSLKVLAFCWRNQISIT